jgi:hypothetical protein
LNLETKVTSSLSNSFALVAEESSISKEKFSSPYFLMAECKAWGEPFLAALQWFANLLDGRL